MITSRAYGMENPVRRNGSAIWGIKARTILSENRGADAAGHDPSRSRKMRRAARAATYAKGAGAEGGMHTWTYMSDPQTGRLAANPLEYAPGKFDWTEDFDEKPAGAILLSTKRVGYDAEANGGVGQKRSETTYDEMQTNVDFRKTHSSLRTELPSMTTAARARHLRTPSIQVVNCQSVITVRSLISQGAARQTQVSARDGALAVKALPGLRWISPS